MEVIIDINIVTAKFKLCQGLTEAIPDELTYPAASPGYVRIPQFSIMTTLRHNPLCGIASDFPRVALQAIANYAAIILEANEP